MLNLYTVCNGVCQMSITFFCENEERVMGKQGMIMGYKLPKKQAPQIEGLASKGSGFMLR